MSVLYWLFITVFFGLVLYYFAGSLIKTWKIRRESLLHQDFLDLFMDVLINRTNR